MMNETRTSGDQDTGMEDIRTSGQQEKKIAGFERLWVWQKSHGLMLEIHQICKSLPRQESFSLRSQIERSSLSVPDNIAEGYTTFYYKDKIKEFYIARKEAGESQNHIRTLQNKNYIDQKKAEELIKRYEEVIRGINGYIRWIKQKRKNKQ